MSKYDNICNFLNSAIAVGLAEIITLPICTIKTNLQNNPNHLSINNTIQYIYNSRGIKGFYKASVPAILSQMFSTSSKYGLYQYFNNINGDMWTHLNIPNLGKMINGSVAGIISSIVTHPLDMVKIHKQMNSLLTVRAMVKMHGANIIYRGYTKTLGKVIVASALYFPLYDFIKSKINNGVLSSIITAIISCTIMQPLDYMKTRQIYGLNPYNTSIKFSLKSIYSNIRYYNRGLSLNLMRIVPHFCITMYIIDFLQNIQKQ